MTEFIEPSIETVAAVDLPRESAPGVGVARVWLKPRKARPFFGRHPWVLDSAVGRIEGEPADGDVVDLISDKGRFVARGLFNSQSRIRVRLYTWSPTELLDDAFLRRRLEAAITLRRQLGGGPIREPSAEKGTVPFCSEDSAKGDSPRRFADRPYDDPNGAARLVFSEADGLSGLIVDRYGEYLAIQPTALAIARRLEPIVAMLTEVLRPRGIVLRNERGLPHNEGINLPEGTHWGQVPDGPIFIEEHGLRYGVDLREGQKTGFYLDQRENRRAAAAYCRGRRVLDLFCYSGGFGLAASRLGEAREVLAIDGSAKAIAMAQANAQLNGVPNMRFDVADGFQALDSLAATSEKFGVVVLDPPKFARSRAALPDALMAYHRINRTAVGLLEPGGILVTCSCSGHVTREDLLHTLSGVAQRSGREIQILEQRGASPDHPISASCLESEYLKCFICRVV